MNTLLTEANNIVTNQQAIVIEENGLEMAENNLADLTSTHIMYVMSYLRAEYELDNKVDVQKHVSLLMTYAGYRVNKNNANPYGNTKPVKKVYTNVTAFKDFELDFVNPDKRYDTRIEKVNKEIIKAFKAGVNILDLLAVTSEYGITKLIKDLIPTKNDDTNGADDTDGEIIEPIESIETITLSGKFTCLDVLTVIQKQLSPDMQDKLNHDILMVIQSYNNELKAVA